MADLRREAMSRSLSFLSSKGKTIILKPEQEKATEELLIGSDVLAVLPTGFGKSMIYTVFALAARELQSRPISVIVISPLKSIVADQIAELDGICSAAELRADNLEQILKDPPTFIFASAEQVLEQRFLRAVRDFNTLTHQRICALVVDESHTVETWSGKRKTKGKQQEAFREAYGKLSILRSMCKEGTPMLALTGTADALTQKTIMEELLMSPAAVKLLVSPNRTNLKFSKQKVKKAQLKTQLDWLVKDMREKGVGMAKTLIFCNSLGDIANLTNWLMMELGDAAYYPVGSKRQENCLVAIYHSQTLQQNKERVTSSLKGNGIKRVVIATTALSMGVNFPDIRNVVMYGPPRSVLDFHQEAGRAGRDGLPSYVKLFFHGQQTTHCEQEMRTFLNSSGCVRVAAYASLDSSVSPMQPLHSCCSTCSLTCECGCEGNGPETVQDKSPEGNTRLREVTESDMVVLRNSLIEIKSNLDEKTPFGSLHGFSSELIEDVVVNSDKIFSFQDIVKYTPVFYERHAVVILEVLSEIFDDCDENTVDIGTVLCSMAPDSNITELLNSDYEDFDEAPEFL